MKFRAFFAELVGTFGLVFVGVGAAAQGTGGPVGAALAFGLVIAALIYLFEDISGAYFNPAITFALALNRTIEWMEAIFYWIAQCLGSVLAAALLYYLFGGAQNGLGATVLASGVDPLKGVVVEALLTFFLTTAVFFGAVEGYAGKRAGMVIGLVLVAIILMGAPLTGASLNPARTLGPAIFTGTLGQFWIYLVGPFVGAAAAFGFYRGIKK